MAKTVKNKKVYEENINGIEGKAVCIVFPDSLQEIKNTILASQDIVPRGSGTSFVLGVLPQDSVIIDFSKMNRILDIDHEKRTALVEPGVLLKELNEELEKFNLEFPIDPLFGSIETIGGMLAKNSSGSKEVKYGKMFNWTDSLEIINGKAQEIKISKPDLSDVLGMEGTTGLITKATLRLTSRKKRSINIIKSETIPDILQANKRLRLKQDICSITLLNKQISSLLGFEKKNHLFIEYDIEEGIFKSHDYEKYLNLKNQAYNKIANDGFYFIESLRIFSENLLDMLTYLETKQIPYFGFLSSGVIFMCFKNEEREKQKRLEALKFAKRLRSNISYGLGYGLLNREFLDRGEKDLIKRIKLRYDPFNKLNKNKLIDLEEKSFVKEKEETQEQKESEKLEEPEKLEKTEKQVEEETEENKQEVIDKIIEEQITPEITSENIIEKSETITLEKQENLSVEEKKSITSIAFGSMAKPKAIEQEESENKRNKEGGYIG